MTPYRNIAREPRMDHALFTYRPGMHCPAARRRRGISVGSRLSALAARPPCRSRIKGLWGGRRDG